MRRTAALIAVLVTAPVSAAPPAGKAAADVDALMAQFAKAPGLSARFREEKHIALLDAPVVNEGTIHFMPPGRFARHTEKPLASTLLIDGGKLQFGDADGGKQSLELSTNPVAKLFVDSFVMIISGDRKGLERVFSLALSPAGKGAGADAWKLVLTPKVSPMDKVIKSITLSGAGLALRDLEVRESSGDWSRTTFADVDVNHRYDAAEAARVFKVPTR